MRVIGFITEPTTIRRILDHLRAKARTQISTPASEPVGERLALVEPLSEAEGGQGENPETHERQDRGLGPQDAQA
jgi:hypothetical protein